MNEDFYAALLQDLDAKVGELVSELLRAQKLRAELVALIESKSGNTSPRSRLD